MLTRHLTRTWTIDGGITTVAIALVPILIVPVTLHARLSAPLDIPTREAPENISLATNTTMINGPMELVRFQISMVGAFRTRSAKDTLEQNELSVSIPNFMSFIWLDKMTRATMDCQSAMPVAGSEKGTRRMNGHASAIRWTPVVQPCCKDLSAEPEVTNTCDI